MQNQQEALHVGGPVGMDEALLQALDTWASGIPQVVSKTGHLRSMFGYGIEVGTRSLGLVLGEHGRMIVIPSATTGDRGLLGAIGLRQPDAEHTAQRDPRGAQPPSKRSP